MCASANPRRASAEIDSAADAPADFKIGDRSIHHFWHLFSPHFRSVFLAPHRRPDSGRVAWTWREPPENRPVTAIELAEVRRRLAEAAASLAGEFGGLARDELDASALERQVREIVTAMAEQLAGRRDAVLATFVCRTDAGLMVHSWGATTAAEPRFPDATAGEISGAVLVGTRPLAGADVVLATSDGLAVAQTKSDRDGGFRFSGVVAGSYRVKVAARRDFPGEGLAVTLERDSVTGLELRGAEDESSPSTTAPPSAVANPTPRRWRNAALPALLMIAGVGGGIFLYLNRARDATSGTKTPNTGWRSATEASDSDRAKATASDDAPKVGAADAWSTLAPARTISAPSGKIPSLSERTGHESDRASLESDDPGLPDSGPSDHMPESNSRTKASATGVAPPASKPGERGKTASPGKKTGQAGGADDQTKDSRGDAGTRSDEKGPKKSAVSTPVSKKPSVMGGGSVAADPSAEEEPPSGVAEKPADSTALATASGGGNSGRRSGGGSQPNGGAIANGPDASPESEAPAVGTEAASPMPGRPASTAAKSSPANRTAGRNQGPAGSGTGSARTDSAAESGAVPDNSDDAAASAESTEKKTSRPSKGPKSAAVSLPSEQTPSPNAADESEPAATESNAGTKPQKTAKAAASAGNPKINPDVQGTDAGDDSKSGRETAQEESANDPTESAAKKNAPGKKPRASAAEKVGGSPEDLAEIATASSSRAEIDGNSADAGGPVADVGRIRARGWQARLLRDAILPTRPMTAAEEEKVEAMREESLRQRRTQMPPAFRQPRVRNGFALEVSAAAGAGAASLRWRGAAEGASVGATIRGTRAELGWPHGGAPRNAEFVLLDTAGRELAGIRFDGTGAPFLRLAGGVRGWWWTGLERSPGNAFEWRLDGGEPVPAEWPRDDRWDGNRGQRIDVPLDRLTSGDDGLDLVLVDAATGWALAGGIGFERK